MTLKILDLYCGTGGAADGIWQAFPGCRITGVDNKPQPRYPFHFIQADALEFDLSGYDFIWSSPPCQKNTKLRNLHMKNGYAKKHVDLIGKTRDRLTAQGAPWVMENVIGAPLIDPIMLCGSMFPELRVYRHRLFETSFPAIAPEHQPHHDKTPSAGRGMSPKGFVSVCGTGGVMGVPYSYLEQAMGITWMKKYELSQSIPPAFSKYVVSQWRS